VLCGLLFKATEQFRGVLGTVRSLVIGTRIW
jgi:hypothetical protein